MKIEVEIKQQKLRAVKKILGGKKEFEQIIQKVVDDQINHIIQTNYTSHRTVDEMVSDLNKQA